MPGDLAKLESFKRLVAILGGFGLWNLESGLSPEQSFQATSSPPGQARSESVIAINPLDPGNMIGASKKFLDPVKYKSEIGPIFTFNGGRTWRDSRLPMEPGWEGMTDPTVAFDRHGNAFLIGEPLTFPPATGPSGVGYVGHGMYAFRSTDGGRTWERGRQLSTFVEADKQWVTCDCNPFSPHEGNVYAAWAANEPLEFARSTDHGVSWKGVGGQPPGSRLAPKALAPDLSVSPNGALHILWHNEDDKIEYVRSTDGGNAFETRPAAVTGVRTLSRNLPITGNWPHFEHGKFRVGTWVTSCAGPGGLVVVAWADMRDGHSRIYYRRSLDFGLTWLGPPDGQPLLPGSQFGEAECFHPQLQRTGMGVVGCSFYVLGPASDGRHLIRVQLAGSWDYAATFPQVTVASDRSWDPLVNPPFSRGDSTVHFIGEYMGLDAGDDSFALLWTDTGTGQQELRSAVVRTKVRKHIPELIVQIIFGVIQDGGGWIFVGGKFVPIPPHSPLIDALASLAAQAELFDADAELEDPEQSPSP